MRSESTEFVLSTFIDRPVIYYDDVVKFVGLTELVMLLGCSLPSSMVRPCVSHHACIMFFGGPLLMLQCVVNNVTWKTTKHVKVEAEASMKQQTNGP
jgi:hypothetical protein